MDYSAANTALWNIIIQLGFIGGAILLAGFLRNKAASPNESCANQKQTSLQIIFISHFIHITILT